MRNFDETGKEFLSNYFGYEYTKILSSIPERQAVVFGKGSSCENPVLIQVNDRDKFKEVFRSKYPIKKLPEWKEPVISIQEVEEQDDIIYPPETTENEDLPF